MRDHQNGLAFLVDAGEEVQDVFAAAGIQGACRFVRQEDLRVSDQGPGDGYPLFLSAGNLIGVLLEDGGNAQGFRQRGEFFHHHRIFFLGEHQREQGVVFVGEGIQEVEVLEDKAKVAAAEGRQFLAADLCEIAAVEQHLAGGWPVKGGEYVQQGGFAGSGFTHDGDKFPFLHVEIHIVQSLDLGAGKPARIDLFQIPHFK